MANGLTKGFTQVSNKNLENITKNDFTKREYKVLLWVFRNGYGWGHKQSACALDTNKIANDTGLDVSNINETFRLLESKNVIKREEGQVLFNRHVDQWKKVETTSKNKRSKQPRNKVKTTSEKGQNNLSGSGNGLSDSDIQPLKESLKKKETPIPPKNGGLSLNKSFNQIWASYPNKVNKSVASGAFQKIKPNQELFDTMLNAIETQKRSHGWTKDNGEYIPHLSTWLKKARWEDELEKTAQSGFGLSDSYTGIRGFGL